MALSLFLQVNEKKVSAGELPEATVRLINEGPDMVIVNARMLLAPINYPDQLKELSFIITGPEGSDNLKKFRVNAGRATTENFARLFPGEYIFQTYELSKYFSYEVTGKYKLIAEYSNAITVVVHDTISWVGKIISNEDWFELV